MDSQTALIIWAMGAYIGFILVYAFEGGGADAVAAAVWPIALLAAIAVLAVVLPAEGVKWCVHRIQNKRR